MGELEDGIKLIKRMGFDADLANNLIEVVRISVEAGREAAIEECAKIAEAWEKPSVARLRAGEMHAQELRTVLAVAASITRSIRSLATPPREVSSE